MKEGRENSLESLSQRLAVLITLWEASSMDSPTHLQTPFTGPGSPKGFFSQFPSELLQDSARLLQLETESGVSENCSKLGTKKA